MNPDASLAISRLTPDSERSSAPRPPTARRQPVEHVIHGDRRVDDYVWLRDKHNPEVIAHLNAENAYTDAILRDTAPFQEKLYQEMLGRILQTDLSVPYRLRGYLYFTRTEEGKQYLMHLRRRDTENAPEELLLDLNALAAGHSFLSLGAFAVSDDNSLLAYSLDTTGFRQYTLQIKNLTTGETLPVRIERVTSAAWAADNRTLFYTVEDETTKRSYRLYRHVLGATELDTLLYEERDEPFRLDVDRTPSGAFLLLTIATHPPTEARFLAPRSVCDFDLRTGQQILRKQQPVLGGYDPSQYASERLLARAPDSTTVPLSVVYRRDTPRDGSAPLLLYGYGSYGISVPVNFSSNRLSLLDRGVIYAIAHVRGGGELGKPWHDAGRMHKKRNTFTDFIAAAQRLIALRYTARDRLVIEGGSAGGLLMGAVANLRPDLFRIVISHVPFVDVLNTMLDASLPLTVGEYEECGNPQIAADYSYMKSYDPYTNLERKPYPTMLVKTSLNDSQVMYWEPAKCVAKLRTLKTDANPLLLKINMGAGHGGASGRYDYLREIALDYAFLLTHLGIVG